MMIMMMKNELGMVMAEIFIIFYDCRELVGKLKWIYYYIMKMANRNKNWINYTTMLKWKWLMAHLSICGRREYHGVGSSLRVRWSSKVVTVCASQRTRPMFLAFLFEITLADEDPWLLAVEPLSLDPELEVEFRLEFEEWRSLWWPLEFEDDLFFWPEELLSPFSKLMRISPPRSPHGSVSAIRMISRATWLKRSGGRSTSPQLKWTFFAARRHCSKWRDTDRTVAVSSGDSESYRSANPAPKSAPLLFPPAAGQYPLSVQKTK